MRANGHTQAMQLGDYEGKHTGKYAEIEQQASIQLGKQKICLLDHEVMSR